MTDRKRSPSDIAGAPFRESQKPSQFCNANVCAYCGEKFLMGITVLRVEKGWVHPECARKAGEVDYEH